MCYMIKVFLETLRCITFAHTRLQKRQKNSFLKGIWKVEMLGWEVLKELLDK